MSVSAKKTRRPAARWFDVGVWTLTACLFAAAPASATTIVFQEGQNGYVGTADTFLAENAPSAAPGSLEALEWDSDDPPGTGRDTIALIRFDNIFGAAPGRIPLGSQFM